MSDFDFDRVIDRRGTNSLKWDSLAERYGMTDPDAIPMWVADMDFATVPEVSEALRAAADHGVMGYFGDRRALDGALRDWLETRHGWRPEAGWIQWSHGLVAGIGFCLMAFTEPGDGVVLFTPVYHAFGRTIRAAGRDIVESELAQVQGRYEMDLERLDRELPDHARIVILCSPHNPGGRVWRPDELSALAEFCARRDLLLISDEIHNDLVFSGATHHVTHKVAPEIEDRLITMVAATKTFNLASALTGAVIIPNPELRRRFARAQDACGSAAINRFGAIASTAAWRHGGPWVDALVPYLEANRDRLDRAVAEAMPGVRSMHLEATYLAWLEFSGTGRSLDEVTEMIEKRAKIAVNKGPTFGKGGETWLRFNFACPRATLDRAIERLADVFARA